MSFADDLNKQVGVYNDKQRNRPTVNDFLNDRIKAYTNDIKQLCTSYAQMGKRRIRGFFQPQRTDYNYETTISGPFMIDKPIELINRRPSRFKKNSFGAYSMDGAYELRSADINFQDGQHLYDNKGEIYPPGYIDFSNPVSSSTIEYVRNGIIQNLSNAGFTRLEINHLTGPKYDVQKVVFKEGIVKTGECHYFFIDIEW